MQKATATIKSVDMIGDNDMILDIAPESATQLAEAVINAKTILWNGPVGVFEVDAFGNGTRILASAVKDSAAFSIAGGGDTLAAIDKYQVADGKLYVYRWWCFSRICRRQSTPSRSSVANRSIIL